MVDREIVSIFCNQSRLMILIMSNLYYCKYHSPIGDIFIGFLEDGIFRIKFGGLTEEDFVRDLMNLYLNCGIKRGNLPSLVKKEFDLYFDGNPIKFRSRVIFLTGTGFQKKVWEEVGKIPYGRLVSYSDIALEMSKTGAERAVGNAVGANPVPIIIPCHRVIRKDGGIGGFGAGIALKKKLLRLEGIIVSGNIK
ncbi:MAG: methylated-DNA--[protein]-cysteine S-methyltransferase [Candidatus Helarchaeota archaeon]|nr:methylated-DNA--[protein]-cysteine S-methyltransferase [Candidatus Helarchaeota archaeon]